MGGADSPDYFRDLYELSCDRSADLDERIRGAITVGRDRLGLDYGLLTYTGDGVYEVVDSTVENGDYRAGTTHDLDETWCRHVVDSRELVVISDAPNSPYHDDVALTTTGLACYIGAPLVVDGEVYGTLCYSGDDPREEAFDESAEQFVELLAEWTSHEIERERHQRELAAQNRRLEEFAGVLAHDLRNPLTAAKGYAELAHEESTGDVHEYVGTVLSSLDRMDTLITDVLSLARDGASAGDQTSIDVETVAGRAWATVDPDGATLRLDAERRVLANESRLEQLFENLFRNVGEHCGPGTTVTVRGTDDGFVVEDDGPGLPSSLATSLFDPSEDVGDHGLGLLIVERIVDSHGWSGRVETSEGGTRFVFGGVQSADSGGTPRPA
ncbi:GAF domain-containing sensor histidine kinase [Haloarcula litorea]|uniref:sensor histidine kinase n=1 Tax=Haloarcula litorea TaxID=3032579 RepID=UPI0023E84E01|nr:GAF domain-containing sensor histidine kinase [Halomicroarcula sp. GDY20]